MEKKTETFIAIGNQTFSKKSILNLYVNESVIEIRTNYSNDIITVKFKDNNEAEIEYKKIQSHLISTGDLKEELDKLSDEELEIRVKKLKESLGET